MTLKTFALSISLTMMMAATTVAAQTAPAQAGTAPLSNEALLIRAAKFVDSGNYRFAIGDLSRVLRSDPTNAAALALRGTAYSKNQESDKALADLTSAIGLSPQNAGFYDARAEAYDSAGKLSSAKADREQAARLRGDVPAAPAPAPTRAEPPAKPPAPPIDVTPAVVQPAPAAPAPVVMPNAVPSVAPKAEPSLAPSVAPSVSHPTPNATPVQPKTIAPQAEGPKNTPTAPLPASGRRKDVTPTKVHESVLATENPTGAASGSAEAHNRRGRELAAQGKYQAAIVELNLAISAKPDSPQFLNARGFSYFMVHDTKRALADLDEAIRLNPKYRNAYQNRSAARKRAGDAAGSASDLSKAKALAAKK